MPPGGYSRGLAEPGARSVQEISDRGHRVTFTWFDPPFRPEPPCNQAYGICFTEAGTIVLGAWDGDGDGERYWNLLGGGVEPGDTLEDSLVRQVMEEVCARGVKSRYIGCQRGDDHDHPTGPWRYYRSRFWARSRTAMGSAARDRRAPPGPARRLPPGPELGLRTQRRHHPCGRAQGRGRTQTGLTVRRVLRRSPTDPVRENALSPRARNGTAGFRIRAGARTTRTLNGGHGRLRAQNIRLGIADAVTEPASTAAPIGGSRVAHGNVP